MEVVVLSIDKVDRLRSMGADGFPVLSVYVGLEPGTDALRSLPTRLNGMLAEVKREAEDLPREQRLSLRADVDAVVELPGRVVGKVGRGVAVFRSTGSGIDEVVELPGPVRDRVVVDTSPYVRPLDSMLEHYRRFCVVVVDRRIGSIFRFHMGQLETWEEMREEEIRKANYGGFSGYDERRVRSHADEVAARHYREVAARLYDLERSEPGFDLLIAGGPDEHVAGLIDAMHPDLEKRLAGTFSIDPGTMTPAIVLTHSRRVADDFEADEQRATVERLRDTVASGGSAVLGMDDVVAAVNQRAVEVLVVRAGVTEAGAACDGCGWVMVEEEPACPGCGGEVRAVPDVIDATADSVRTSGGRVQHILVESTLDEDEVGAFLRYRLETTAPV
ncbi:MAG: hypothetical protein U9O63_02445 [Actinomycetota bacterium]|nr:hypothetical protein [Actinomycetota bacterium]